MDAYESLRAQIEAHEAEEARLLAEVDALRARAEAAEAALVQAQNAGFSRALTTVVDIIRHRAEAQAAAGHKREAAELREVAAGLAAFVR